MNKFTVELPWLDMKLSTNRIIACMNRAGMKPSIARGIVFATNKLIKEKKAAGKKATILAMETQSTDWMHEHVKRNLIQKLLRRKRMLDVHIELTPPTNIWRDCDNMTTALKSTLDGIAQGLGIDDKYFRSIPWINDAIGRDNACVKIHIMPMNEKRPF